MRFRPLDPEEFRDRFLSAASETDFHLFDGR